MTAIRPSSVEVLRPLSKVAFGQELRLPLILAIGREAGPSVDARDLLGWVNASSMSHIERPLNSLLAMGAISRIASDGNMQSPLRRNETLLWEYAEELARSYASRPIPEALF